MQLSGNCQKPLSYLQYLPYYHLNNMELKNQKTTYFSHKKRGTHRIYFLDNHVIESYLCEVLILTTELRTKDVTWKTILGIILIKLNIKKPKEEEKRKPFDITNTSDCDRTRLHDWHNNTIDKLEPIPEVERYKEYVKNESIARAQRIRQSQVMIQREIGHLKLKEDRPKKKKKKDNYRYYDNNHFEYNRRGKR